MKKMLTTMKRLILLLAAVCCTALTASAQDVIYKTDARKIEARILEISTTEVRYKRFSNPDGPTYVLPVADISHIVYQNGDRDDFNPAAPDTQNARPAAQPTEKSAARKTAVNSAAAQTPATESYGSARPSLGQLYDDNGVRGIVIWLDDSGMHGLMLSLAESAAPRFLPWTTIRSPYPETGATNKVDGRENMKAVERCIADNGLSWDDFPAFKWCRELGEGWYLPAIDELLTLGYRFNGGQRMKFDRKARQQFNAALKDGGGVKVDPMVNYYSSTYMGEGLVATSTMEVEPPYVLSYKAHERYLVRAVRRF